MPATLSDSDIWQAWAHAMSPCTEACEHFNEGVSYMNVHLINGGGLETLGAVSRR